MPSLCPSLFLCLILALGQSPPARTLPPDRGRVTLEAARARLTGEHLAVDKASGTITGLAKPAERLEWPFQVDRDGWYQVVVHYSLKELANGKKPGFNATVGDQNRLGPIHPTGDSSRFLPQVLFDPIELKAGSHRLSLKLTPDSVVNGLAIRKVELVRAPEPGVP
ncbi:MAG: hypothetical protein ACKO5E_01370 [bacterium]